jgi:hypothetical protein
MPTLPLGCNLICSEPFAQNLTAPDAPVALTLMCALPVVVIPLVSSFPEDVIWPTTCKALTGLVVPMPTLPRLVILIGSANPVPAFDV